MSVMRYDPFGELDRAAEQLLADAARRRQPRSFPMDAYRRGDRFFVHMDLPGVEADSIELTSEQNVLTITAERRFETNDEDQVVAMERPQGTFSRQLFLSESLDSEQIQATYDKGVLTLEIPVAERAKPRRIEIGGSGSGPTTIEGSSTAA